MQIPEFQKAYVFPADGWPKWAYTDIWGPEIHRINGNYYVYFSARKRSGEFVDQWFRTLFSG